jgi:hypothetical protein
MRGVFLSVALESLTSHLVKVYGLKAEGPLCAASWKAFHEALQARFLETATQEEWTDAQKRIIGGRIDGLNQPTNADKLAVPFRRMEVPVTADEAESINDRNRLLHAGRLLDPDVLASDPNAWRKPYTTEMRIYTAVNKLLLAYLGYEGPLIDWGETPIGALHYKFVFLRTVRNSEVTVKSNGAEQVSP